MTQHLEKCIRYFGSSDIAYAYRHLVKKQRPAGISPFSIVEDVSKRLKIQQWLLGTLEAQLEQLVKAVAERTFFELPPEKQRELFYKAGISKKQQKEFFSRIKENKALFFPFLLSTLGSSATVKKLTEGLALSFITR